MPNLLLITVLLPAAGAALIWVLGEVKQAVARRLALGTVLATLAMAGWLLHGARASSPGQSVNREQGETSTTPATEAPATDESRFPDTPEIDVAWLPMVASGMDIRFSLGLDGLGIGLFGLAALLSVTAVLVSWESITDRPGAFYALLLLLETGMLGVFAARDIILFYVFFEFTLIPLFFLIGIWGSEERRYAAIKFFLFTLAGSLLTFLGLIAIVLWDYQHSGTMTFSIAELERRLTANPMALPWQLAVFVALFAGFAIKVPLFPLHTWLPLAHVQAPTAGSVILAGVLLKVGTYGFLRFSLPLLPDATVVCMPWLLWLSVAGIIYGALVALAQSDMKRLIAYSSVSHLGFCMLGVFALTKLGMQGGVLQMINHGLSTGGLFALVGMIYDRYHTREIASFGGLARRAPWLAACMVLFTLSSIGLPGLNGFAGEFLLLAGMFQRAWTSAPAEWSVQWITIAVLAVFGVVLGAWYMLWLIERVFFGKLVEPGHPTVDPQVRDLSLREVLALAPLIVFIFWIGIAPQVFLSPMQRDLNGVLATVTDSEAYRERLGVAGTEYPNPRPRGGAPDTATANTSIMSRTPGAIRDTGGADTRVR